MKKMIKKLIAGGMILVLAAGILTGCIGKSQESADSSQALTILLRSGTAMEDALRKKFPAMNLAFEYYDGLNTTSNLMMRVKCRDIPDVFVGTLPLEQEDSEAVLMDISGYEFCDNYDNAILSQYDIDGNLYQLPGAVTIRCIVYNKSMFKEHGWKEPQSFDELVALCRQIREETDDITPIVFGGAGVGYYFTTMTTYAQAEYIYTPEGAEWEKEYLKGTGSAEEGFGEGIRMTQELIDAGAFDYDKNKDMWDSDIFEKRMITGEAAMQFAWGGQQALFGRIEEEEEFAPMPFRNRAGDAFIGTNTSYNMGISKKLKEPGNEQKLKDALNIMGWFATEEGLSSLSVVDGSIIFPLKDAKNDQTIPQFLKLWNENLDGIKAPMIYTGYEGLLIQTADQIVEAVQGKHDLSGLAAYMDEIHRATLEEDVTNKEAYVGSFARDFTHEETVQTLADILHSKRDSDITLVSDGMRIGRVKNSEGAHSRFYNGVLPYDWVTIFVPGTLGAENQMVQMTLTGAQIQELLEKGKNMVVHEGENKTYAREDDETTVDSSRYPYYWSGMTAELKNGKISNMKLEGGPAMKPDQTYTVSFAASDYMDSTAEAGNPVKLDYSAHEVFEEYMQDNSPVSPSEVLRKERK